MLPYIGINKINLSYNAVELAVDLDSEVRPRPAVWEQSGAGQLITASLPFSSLGVY